MRTKALLVLLLFLLPILTGCTLSDYYQKIENVLDTQPKYVWVKTIHVEDKFGWLDVINEELAKVVEYPIFIEKQTKYLHIYINVEFSNPINPSLNIFNYGRFNLTITNPSGDSTEKSYVTTGKSYTYDDYFTIDNPETGNWEISINVFGYGRYIILVETYVPS
jgi:hypothetical protein